MSYQIPPTSGGPQRNTPIPGESTIIQGTPIPDAAPTPSMFLGTQGMEPPPPISSKPKKDRNWGFWVVALLIVVPTVVGIGAAVWGVLVAKDAVDKANGTIDDITIPDFSIPDLSGGDGSGSGNGSEVSLLIGDGPAAAVAALDAGIIGDPTNFIEIVLYPEYAFGTAQDPVRPERIDRYQLQSGTVGAGAPQTNDPEAASKVFTIDLVTWDAIATLAAEAPRLAAVEEGEVTHIIIGRDIFTDAHDVVVRVYVSGPRSSAFIEATADGTILRIV
jgi:hypothetical protein